MLAERVNAVARRLLSPFGIEPITPLAFAAFRTTFGLGLLYVQVAYEPFRAKAFDVRNPHGPLADTEWLYAMAMSHTAASIFQFVACAAAILFIAGVFARLAYVVVVSMMFINVQMILTRTGGHDWGLPIMTLIVMTIVPWNEAPSLWQLRRSRKAFAAPRLASRVYGFAVWIPGLMMGLAFAAAAYAKVGGTGMRWITNGTVRYHFVEDGRNAPVTLGLWIATHERLSIALSFAAVLVEAIFILVVFARDWKTRLGFGLMGASLMAGFTLLQGVAWWPWRVLFLALLPWTLLRSAEDTTPGTTSGGSIPSRPRDLTWAHATLVVSLVGVQIWASWKAVEMEPLISNYPMYANTWPSPEEFNRRQARTQFEVDGADISGRIEGAAGDNLLRDMAAGHGDDASSRELVARDLPRFTERYQRMYGDVPHDVDVVVVQRPFDWQAGRYLPQTRERIGTVHLSP